ncbi:MAG: hypothetical protein OEZ34_11120 [Spirochaetia bacterium]|nr:hypothetical protein [Spirochaetia bacterium]
MKFNKNMLEFIRSLKILFLSAAFILMALFSVILNCKRASPPEVQKINSQLQISKKNNLFKFAKNGNVWAAVWQTDYTSWDSPVQIEKKRNYILTFDENFKILSGPEYFSSTPHFTILPVQEGFAIIYGERHTDKLECVKGVLYSIKKNKLKKDGCILPHGYNFIPADYNNPFEDIAAFSANGKIFMPAESQEKTSKIFSVYPGEDEKELITITEDDRIKLTLFSGSFNQNYMFAWVGLPRYSSKPITSGMHYMIADSEYKEIKRGKLNPLFVGRLKFIEDNNGFSLLSGDSLHKYNHEGKEKGRGKKLLNAKASIYNEETSFYDSSCLITFQTHDGLEGSPVANLFTCRKGKSVRMKDFMFISSYCSKNKCIVSRGNSLKTVLEWHDM